MLPSNHPNPPLKLDPNSQHLYTTIDYTSYYSHQPQNPNPNSSTISVDPPQSVRPPGIDPLPSSDISYYSLNYHGAGAGAGAGAGLDPSLPYAQHPTVETAASVASSGYIQGLSVAASFQNWAAKEVVRLYGSTPYATGVTMPPNGVQQLAAPNPNLTLWTSSTTRPNKNSIWKKGLKKAKFVQSVWCEICKIDCNSKDVLEQHKLGKKHKRNLEKLKESIAPANAAVAAKPTGQDKPIIGPQENPNKGKTSSVQNTRRKANESVEDLETKKRKVLEGGAAADAVRTCTICNVVCNSEVVFKYHLAGQKHAATLKKHASGTGVAIAT